MRGERASATFADDLVNADAQWVTSAVNGQGIQQWTREVCLRADVYVEQNWDQLASTQLLY
ncbi:MAG: hypothetical protein EOO65_03420 [Methanosarcinales archaeon]|nr:MAG: hypothetical protein EOO65_03420 [Methanosarcinales archaeon]